MWKRQIWEAGGLDEVSTLRRRSVSVIRAEVIAAPGVANLARVLRRYEPSVARQ